jgi:hypothetical protein
MRAWVAMSVGEPCDVPGDPRIALRPDYVKS